MKISFYSFLLFSIVLVLMGCTAKKSTTDADLAFINGRVWTGMDSASFAEAVAVKGDTIFHVGTTAAIKKSIGKQTKVIDLDGKLLIPGFNDAHIHFLSGSIGLTEVDLTGASTIQEVVYRIKTFAKENLNKKWITGRGWQYTMFKGGLPTKEILDSAISNRPVYIKAYDGHSAWGNSPALKQAKVDRETKFDGFGEIVKFPNGELTGVFKEKAMSLVSDNIPELTKAEQLNALRKGLKLAKSLGITSIANASGNIAEFNLYKTLLNNGELTLRVATAFSVDGNISPEAIKMFTALKDSVGNNPRLTARNVKFVLDGVIEAHTAGMLEPYSNLLPGEKSPNGTLSLPLEKYGSLVTEFDQLGFQVYTHAIGDRAVREALNAYELALKTNETVRRNRIEHIETISPDDLPRFAKLGVLPSMEPIHAEPGNEPSVWEKGVGQKRLPYSFAWASILKAGGHLVFSSDWPACLSINPIRGLHVAVTRKNTKGEPNDGWVSEQKISITKALIAYTQGGAYSSFEESSKGKIEVGQLADLVVLSQDLFTIDPMKTYETRVLMTVFDGKVIFNIIDQK